MFERSPRSLKFLTYLKIKYGPQIAPVGLLTLCAVASARTLKESMPIGFNICKVAPSGAFKSRTSTESMQIAPEEYFISLQSDFTLHSIHREYDGDVRNKCLFINDGTLLLGSKQHKAKERIINGLAEVLSDGKYHYSDFRENWDIRGPCTCVFNITPKSFQMYATTLFGSTFVYRFLPVHYNIPRIEQRDFQAYKDSILRMRLRHKVYLDENSSPEVELGDFKEAIHDYGDRWSALAGFPLNRMTDQVEALVRAHAFLNQRNTVCRDELSLLDITEQYVSNPMRENAAKIRELYLQGNSVRDICLILQKDPESYKTTVSRVLTRARLDGTIE